MADVPLCSIAAGVCAAASYAFGFYWGRRVGLDTGADRERIRLEHAHFAEEAPVAETALERWSARCIRAIETGDGIPTVGHLWWKRPDEQVIRAICSALRLADMSRAYGKDGEWLQLQLLDDQASALAIYAARTARGYGLARAWLRDELARDGGDHG